jgi:translation initiation factor IF-3
VNERIRAREVRLIDENGVQLGVLPIREALRVAQERSLDLIEVAPNAQPPVCRIMDYGKHKYQQAKRGREARKKQKGTEVRLLRMKPQIGIHDLQIKLRKLRELLSEGNKVRISVRFRGREMSRPQLGTELMERIAQELADVAQVEGSPRREGRMMNMLVAPKPGVRAAPQKKAKATADGKEQVKQEPTEKPQPVEERPRQVEDTEDSGEAG